MIKGEKQVLEYLHGKLSYLQEFISIIGNQTMITWIVGLRLEGELATGTMRVWIGEDADETCAFARTVCDRTCP